MILPVDYDPEAEGDPPEAKPWWQSRGVVGSLVVIVAQIMAGVGYQVDAGMLTEIALNLAALVGGILALVGRLQAQTPIARR